MMGLGSFDYGGGGGSSTASSSTSNLSPLAPPFTIDHSLPKPNSIPYRFDQSPFQNPFRFSSSASSGNDWSNLHPSPPPKQPSLPPLTSFSDHPNLEFDSSTYATNLDPNSTRSGGYVHHKPYYYDSPPVNNLGGGGGLGGGGSGTPTSNSTSYCFPHSQNLGKASNNYYNEVGADIYYNPTQLSPAIGERKTSPVVIKNRDGSDVLTMSSGTPFEMSTPVLNTHNFSDVGYHPPWGGLWNGSNAWSEQGTGNNLEDGCFGWNEKLHTGSSSFQGAQTEADTVACNKESGVLLTKPNESLAGKFHIGPRDTNMLNLNCSSSMFGSSSEFPQMSETLYPEGSYPGGVINTWNQLNANRNPSNMGLSLLDSYAGDQTIFYPSTTRSPVGSISKFPTHGTTISAPKISHISPNELMDQRGNALSDDANPANYSYFNTKTKDPPIPPKISHISPNELMDQRGNALSDDANPANYSYFNTKTKDPPIPPKISHISPNELMDQCGNALSDDANPANYSYFNTKTKDPPIPPKISHISPNELMNQCGNALSNDANPANYSYFNTNTKNPPIQPKISHVSPNELIDQSGNVFGNKESRADYSYFNTNRKDPLIPLSVVREENIADLGSVQNLMDKSHKTNHTFTSPGKGFPLNSNPTADKSWKNDFNRKAYQVNQFNFADDSTLTPAAAAAVAVAGDSVDTFDQFNPAVDSPCWKGAPTFHSSPFMCQEAGNSSSAFKFQASQDCPVNDGCPITISSRNIVSNDTDLSVDCNLSFASAKPSVDVSNKNTIHFSSSTFLPADSKCNSDINIFQMVQSSNEEVEDTSSKEIRSKRKVGVSGIDINIAPQNGSSPVQSNAELKLSTSPCSEVTETIENIEVLDEDSDISANKLEPKLDTRLLVNSMHNLSELLLATCSNGGNELEEHDREVLMRVINNLNTCFSMKVGLLKPMPKTHFPQSTGSCVRVSSHLDKVASLVSKKHGILYDFHPQIGNPDKDSEKDNGVAQLKNVLLKEHVHDKEEPVLGIQVYKNLWLEAEAALCSMRYNTRLESMKLKIAEYKLQQEKGSYIAEEFANVDKQSSSKVTHDQSNFKTSSSNIKGTITKTSTQKANQSSTAKQDDIDTSVMARLQILKCRVDNSSSSMTMTGVGSIKDGLNAESVATKTSFTQEANQSTANKQDEIDASVMARLHILKCRVDNSGSSMTTTEKQIPGSASNGLNADAAEKSFGSSDGWIKPRSITQDISEDGSSVGSSDGSSDVNAQSTSSNSSKAEPALDHDVPREQVTEKEFRICISDEAIIESYILPGGRYDHPSSDWEHVLKDELI